MFENEFNIGDIITVDGFRGEVIEMGIRTTKLKYLILNLPKQLSACFNQLYARQSDWTEYRFRFCRNNSDLRKILNQTTEPSVAKAYIDIEYGADLGKVEEIIARNLPKSAKLQTAKAWLLSKLSL